MSSIGQSGFRHSTLASSLCARFPTKEVIAELAEVLVCDEDTIRAFASIAREERVSCLKSILQGLRNGSGGIGVEQESKDYVVSVIKEMVEASVSKRSEAENTLHPKGVVVSDETRRKIADTMRGRRCSIETRRKMSEAKRGRRCSIETRRKISETLKRRHQANNKSVTQ